MKRLRHWLRVLALLGRARALELIRLAEPARRPRSAPALTLGTSRT